MYKRQGPGIAPDVVARLFEPFTRSSSDPSSRHGTGLGLAISRSLARLMGGDLALVETGPGGSVFEALLPLPLAAPAEVTRDDEEVGRTSVGGLRALVVDDNPVNLRVAEMMLRHLGVAADVARDGAEAVRVVTLHPYDLVLMDVQMPGVDGLEATRRIRAWEAATGHAPTTIVALTAGALASDEVRCFDAGVDAYVAKPITLAMLESAVSRAMRGRSRA